MAGFSAFSLYIDKNLYYVEYFHSFYEYLTGNTTGKIREITGNCVKNIMEIF